MSDESVWHYVTGRASTRLPRRHIFLDTEARNTKDRTGVSQVWRCGVAIFRVAPKGTIGKERTEVYRDPAQLWRDVDAFTLAKSRTILWTHNLSYDLRIGAALDVLPALGWRVQAHNLEPAGTWIAWRKDDRALVMVDSASVFPVTVAQLGIYFGQVKPALPGDDAPLDMWVKRCTIDAQILRNAVVAYLDKLDAEDLGPWQPTGTGQAWAGFRHRFLTHRMLVHFDEDARAAERRAMWTGRCEAYWHGKTERVRVDEWDMTLAYVRIAATVDVPTEMVARFSTNDDMDRWMRRFGYDVLAEVEVDTALPLVPTLRDGRIAWPVGRFRTVLWGPEVRLLASRGASFRVVCGWAYRTVPALQEWARWILHTLSSRDPEAEAWWAVVVKHWGRALIGRLAMSYRAWDYWGTLPRRDVRQWTYLDRDTGDKGQMVQIGNDVWVATGDREWSDAQPAITGYIMSVARAELTGLILDAPPRSILYADTDAILCTAEHWREIEHLAATRTQLGLRLKKSWDHVEILGPRQIITGPRVRVAGIPTRAKRLPSGDLEGEIWQSLRGAMRARQPARVRVTPRRWRLHGVDHRRADGPDGWTVPHEVDATESP